MCGVYAFFIQGQNSLRRFVSYRSQTQYGHLFPIDQLAPLTDFDGFEWTLPVYHDTITTWITDHKWSHIVQLDRKSTRLNSSHVKISYAVFCLKKTTRQ